jgi:hypothetical protein
LSLSIYYTLSTALYSIFASQPRLTPTWAGATIEELSKELKKCETRLPELDFQVALPTNAARAKEAEAVAVAMQEEEEGMPPRQLS